MSQVSAKRWKEKIGRKAREEGPCAQSIWKQSQPQCWPEWYLHNSIFLWIRKKVCLDAPADWWTVEPEAEVKTAQSRVTKIQWQRWMCMTIGQECFRTTSRRSLHGDHGRAQSLSDQLLVQRKITKVTQSWKKVHPVGKLVFPSLVAWRACTKIRDAPAEKRRVVQKVQRSSTRNWDAISLVFLRAVLRENFSSFRSTLHNLSHIMFLNVWN